MGRDDARHREYSNCNRLPLLFDGNRTLQGEDMKVTKTKCWLRSALLVCAALVTAIPLFSQAYSGQILGTVTDQTGGAIMGASVTVTDVDRGVSRTVMTDESGQYSAPNLTPGTYRVRVEYKGFRTVERANIAVEVAKQVRSDFTMQPGEQTQTLTVTEQLPLVDATNATLGGTLQPGTIQDLPLNGRNFMNLLQLRPGITIYPGGGAWTQSTNGLRPEHNVYLLDGVATVEPFSAQSTVNSVSLSGDSATELPIDAIQEFNTQENPKAEFGLKPGATVNIALKSGTNDLHGTASAYGRTDALDARNPFLVNGSHQQIQLEDFGATLGGPIKKDKVFFFMGYEGQRYEVGNPAQITFPTMTPGVGVGKSVVDTCLSIAPAALSPTSLKMAGLNPNCTPNTAPGAFTIFPSNPSTNIDVNFPTTFRVDNGLAKVDFHSNKSTLSARLFTGNNNGIAINSSNITQLYWAPAPYSRSYVIGTNWNYAANSSLVNELRFGYNRFSQAFQPQDCAGQGSGAPNDGNYGINFGAESCGFTNITIRSFTGAIGCCVSFPKYQGPDTTMEVGDSLSYLHGKHAFKFGGSIMDLIVNTGTFNRGKGQVTFTDLNGFLTGAVNPSAGAQIFLGNPIRHVTSQEFAGFIQDDYRVTPRLMLNLGIRYEYQTPLKEANGLMANWDGSQGLFQVGQSSNINLRNNLYLPDKNNWAPRVGFAWDVFGNGKTVVRGGGGIMYVLEGFNYFLSQQNQNNPTTGLNTNPSGFALCSGPVSTAAVPDAACNPGPGTIRASGLKLTGASQLTCTALPCAGLNWNQLGGGSIYPSATNPLNFQCGTDRLCGVQATDEHMTSPFVTSWNLGIQHAFSSNVSLDLAYVGNHAHGLLAINDINAPPVGAGYTPTVMAACIANPTASGCAPNKSAEQTARPFNTAFPYLSYIYLLSNYDISNYEGMQATLTQRSVHGLSYTLAYTFAHALDDASNDWSGQPNSQDPRNPQLMYSNSNFDIRNRFTGTLTYQLPGRKGYAQMLEGWELTSIVTIQSALPWGVIGNNAVDASGTAENLDLWNFFGNGSAFSGLGNGAVPYFGPGVGGPAITNPACLAQAGAANSPQYLAIEKWGCFVSGSSVMIPPAIGSYGNLTRNTFRGNGLHLWDFSVIKNWKFTERLGGEFRFEVFNFLNQTQYGNPQFNGAGGNDPFGSPDQFGQSLQTPDVANNNPSLGSGAARSFQMGFRVTW